ncbi:YARHG domain-containing protein [Prevotella sp. HUN102]|uniref:YARHG domain-containing protein n=1 Tax=Prevotella sp. HUN102 TaxID=1392486 RepID=UPI00048A8EE3|nr:YARHG domain-containing protein [Prevotella sp. HUN102]
MKTKIFSISLVMAAIIIIGCQDNKSKSENLEQMIEQRAQQKADSMAKADSINKLVAEAKAIIKRDKTKHQPSPEPQSLYTEYPTEFDYLAQRNVTESDVYRLMDAYGFNFSEACGYLRNAVYARHGRRFVKKQYRDFFMQFDWYAPQRTEIPASELNTIEQRNISKLKAFG